MGPISKLALLGFRSVFNVYPAQGDLRITSQKLRRLKLGSLSAKTSAFTVPKVVFGLRLKHP